jgi:hypothetical protein
MSRERERTGRDCASGSGGVVVVDLLIVFVLVLIRFVAAAARGRRSWSGTSPVITAHPVPFSNRGRDSVGLSPMSPDLLGSVRSLASVRVVRGVAALLLCLLCVIVTDVPGASAGVIGATPQAAARKATDKWGRRQVRAWNRPGASYTLGTCRIVHRRPWLAYGCAIRLHGMGTLDQCLLFVITGVKRLAVGTYRAEAVKIKQLNNC